jgi:flagellar basal body rod protein FlgC
MGSILSNAASGLAAASERLGLSAYNVANANSGGPPPAVGAVAQAQYPAAYVADESIRWPHRESERAQSFPTFRRAR